MEPKPSEVVGLVYPCSFPVKVFVRPEDGVEERLHALVRSHLQPEAGLEVERRASTNGKYQTGRRWRKTEKTKKASQRKR